MDKTKEIFNAFAAKMKEEGWDVSIKIQFDTNNEKYGPYHNLTGLLIDVFNSPEFEPTLNIIKQLVDETYTKAIERMETKDENKSR